MRPAHWANVGIWQVASGSGDRDLTELFLKHDVAAIGGSDREEAIMRDIPAGDLILLRHGHEVQAIGVVADERADLPVDRSGWNLTFSRRVRWVSLSNPYRYKLRQRVSRVRQELPVSAWGALTAAEGNGCLQRPLRDPVPARQPELKHPDTQMLYGTYELRERARKFQSRTYEPGGHWRVPSEHEAVAHFVVPLFRRLGWCASQIALEWKMVHGARRIDLAVFADESRNPASLRFLIEAKRMESGLGEATAAQASRYALQVAKDVEGSTPTVLVTNGFRYYEVNGGSPIEKLDLLYPTQEAMDAIENWRSPGRPDRDSA